MRREDVRKISAEDVKAEGFASKDEFLKVWVSMHDKTASKRVFRNLMLRPSKLYEAWALTFELVQS